MRITPKSVSVIGVLIVVLGAGIGEVGFHDILEGTSYGCGAAALFVIFAGIWSMLHYQK